MVAWLRRRLAPPSFEDEEQTHTASLLHLVLLIAIVFALIYIALAPLFYNNPVPLLLGAALILPLWLLALYLTHQGQVRWAAILLLGPLWLIVTVISFIDGGVHSPATSTYLTVIFASGLLLGPRAGLRFAAGSLAASVVMIWAEASGWLPPSVVADTRTVGWVGLATNILLATALLYPTSRTILGAIERARRNERALAESNQELRAEVAERRRVAEALRESEERYRTILDDIEDGYYETDLAGNLAFFNDALCGIVGYPRSELLGLNNRQYMDTENARRVYQIFNQVYRTGEPSRGSDWELVGKDGTQRGIEASVSLIRDADGQPRGFRGIARDVTERKRAEEALRKSEEWLRTIVEGTHALLVGVTPRGRFTYVNEALARFVGSPAEALIGQLYLRFVYPGDRDRVSRVYLNLVKTGTPVASLEFRALTAEGEVRWVRFVSNPIFQGGRVVEIMGVALDVTDRVQTEQALRESEERWRMYIEQASDLIFSLDTSGRFTAVNQAVCWTTGYSADELLGSSALDLVLPDQRPLAAEMLARIMSRQDIDQAELQVLTKADQRIFLEVRGRFIFEHGEFVGTFHIARDITERKLAEESLRAWAAELGARNAELDAFAHTVAHDLQDPVGVIVGYADLLAEEYGRLPERELQQGLGAIEQSARKMNTIINELLLLAEIRRRSVQNTPLEMGYIVADARERLAHLAEEQKAQIAVPDTWPLALGYAPWVEEVWVNYLSNALKYGGRPPRIELGAEPQAGGLIRFWIRDWGPGLTPEQQVSLFVPFTQLSQVHTGGYGLGLSIVRRIVEKLGGEVGVESEGEAGRGSLFYFTLPAADSQG